MIMLTQKALRACLPFIAIAGISCGPHGPPNRRERNRDPELIGNWVSAPHLTQLGLATDSICFRPDGTVTSMQVNEAGTLEFGGTFAIPSTEPDGSLIEIRIDVGETTMVGQWDPAKGEISIGDHDIVVLRKSGDCR